MTKKSFPERAWEAFADHQAFEPTDTRFTITTTRFDATVTADEIDESRLRYTVTVRTPMLSTAAEEAVGPAVEKGWFETLERRIEGAGGAIRRDIELEDTSLTREDGDAVVTMIFEWLDEADAPSISKSLAEYVEGTYVAGVVPGYEYGEPVAGLLSRASHDDGDGPGGIPPL